MDIYGLTKTTLLDYPGLLASTIFVGACNFKCPFCHNINLVKNPDIYNKISKEEVFEHLNKRKNIIYGICISGGEPTLQKDLIPFINELKDFNLKIKLDTNGYNPELLEKIISNKLVDYIAMDIKASKANYSKASGILVNTQLIDKSINILANGNISYEFRTTCVKGIHEISDFYDISDWLPSNSLYYLQNYKDNINITDRSLKDFSKDELDYFLSIIKNKIPNTFLRGVE